MSESCLVLRLQPIFSDLIEIDTFNSFENENIKSNVVKKVSFDIMLCRDKSKLLTSHIGHITGYYIDVKELLISFKERDNVYIFDFENLGEKVSDIYCYVYENIPWESTEYESVFAIDEFYLFSSYDEPFIYQNVYKLLSKTIGSIFPKKNTHIWDIVKDEPFVTYMRTDFS